jgi:hypothetical protein
MPESDAVVGVAGLFTTVQVDAPGSAAPSSRPGSWPQPRVVPNPLVDVARTEPSATVASNG